MMISSRVIDRLLRWFGILVFCLLGNGGAEAAIMPTGTLTPEYNGTDDPWNVGGDLTVGDGEIGGDEPSTLRIDGGSIVNNEVGYIGDGKDVEGSVTVSGPGSEWNNNSQLYIGLYGVGRLRVEAGAKVRSKSSYIGYNIGNYADPYGEVSVTGSGATWDTHSLYVGDSGEGTLHIASEAIVNSHDGWVGDRLGDTGEVTVSEGSAWNLTDDLYIGRDGNGVLSIQDSVVNVEGNVIVENADGGNGQIIFDGGMLNSGGLSAARNALSGEGTIVTRGLVSDVDLTFDDQSNLQQDIIVSGPNQNITLSLDLSSPAQNSRLGVGFETNGTLSISNGVSVESERGILGVQVGSHGTASITGKGSEWQALKHSVGVSGSGEMNIENGGVVSTRSATLGKSYNRILWMRES